MVLETLKNKKIVISAAASGIGWEIAKTCVSNGASVFLCDIDKKLLNKIKNSRLYNKKIFISHVDASNENNVIDLSKANLILKDRQIAPSPCSAHHVIYGSIHGYTSENQRTDQHLLGD